MKKIFIEAESFKALGGWLIDQQSTLQMGSPYMMVRVMHNDMAAPLKDIIGKKRL